MELLIEHGHFITANVLRLEMMQKQSASAPSTCTDTQNEEGPFFADLINDNLKHIAELIKPVSTDENFSDDQEQISLILEKISCLVCHSCMSKKAKARAKSSKRKSHNEGLEVKPPSPTSSDQDTAATEQAATDAAALSLALTPPSPKASFSPKKTPRKPPNMRPSPPQSGLILSNFFSVVPKEQDKTMESTDDHHLSHLLFDKKTEGFWEYFQPFFVKPNVRIAPPPGIKPPNGMSLQSQSEKEVIEQLPSLPLVKFKLFQFAENIRPCYFGTFSKRSQIINGRRPFVKDTSESLGLDYNVESDEEWIDCCDELEGEVENLSDMDDDLSSEDDEEEDEDSSWLVPHGYLSEDELMDSDENENSSISKIHFADEDINDPVTKKRLQSSWRETTANSSFGSGPKLYSSLRDASEQTASFLKTFSMKPFMKDQAKVNPFIEGLIIDSNDSNLARKVLLEDILDHSSIFSRKKKKRAMLEFTYKSQMHSKSMSIKALTDEKENVKNIEQKGSFTPKRKRVSPTLVTSQNDHTHNFIGFKLEKNAIDARDNPKTIDDTISPEK